MVWLVQETIFNPILNLGFYSQIYIHIFITYLFKLPATKFQTAVKAKKLNHQPVAGKINPSIIACSTTPAIMYCFKVIYYPFYKALMLYEFNIVARKDNLMCNQIVNFGQIND